MKELADTEAIQIAAIHQIYFTELSVSVIYFIFRFTDAN